jgi:hypothetical protein
MTQRKPSNMSVPDFIERQIRSAQAQGAFENLPGAGKPIPNLGQPQHELAWLADYLRRENVDVAELLPPALALAKEVEGLPELIRRQRSTSQVRSVVQDLNDRIRKAHARPQDGPPIRVWIVDVDDAVQQWETAQLAIDTLTDRPMPSGSPSDPPPRRRRRLRWRTSWRTGKS